MEIIHVWMLPCPFRIFSSPVRQTAPGLDEQFRALLNSASWWISTSSGDSGLEIMMGAMKKRGKHHPKMAYLWLTEYDEWLLLVASLVPVQASRGLEDMIEPWNGDISLVDSLVLLPEKNGLVKTHPFHSLGKKCRMRSPRGVSKFSLPKTTEIYKVVAPPVK